MSSINFARTSNSFIIQEEIKSISRATANGILSNKRGSNGFNMGSRAHSGPPTCSQALLLGFRIPNQLRAGTMYVLAALLNSIALSGVNALDNCSVCAIGVSSKACMVCTGLICMVNVISIVLIELLSGQGIEKSGRTP